MLNASKFRHDVEENHENDLGKSFAQLNFDNSHVPNL
jgi:hypothetical protein